MYDILIATHNKNKAREFGQLLKDTKFQFKTFMDIGYDKEIVEDGKTFEENALIKARVAASMGYIGLADDSGLCVDYLNGAPGVYSARYAGEPCDDENNNDKLLDALKDVPNEERTARYVCVIACVTPEGEEFCCKGVCSGLIIRERRGKGGFGYDPLFFFPEFNKTFAEISPEEKNSVSHRAIALKLFESEFKRRLNII